jgi:hypothetical protein
MAEEVRTSGSSEKSSPGPYLAKIVSHLDPTYMGTLEVQLLHEVGNDDAKSGQLHQVRYLSPFAGQTSVDYVGDEDDYDNTQKSYGMWAIPPDVGAIVMVIFVDGDPRKGFWIGCVQDKSMNFMMPGNAASSFNIDGKEERVPVAEYNKVTQATTADPTTIPKSPSLLQDVLETQGLLKDDSRGITTSSARREVPSAVFGISTPGPLDKRDGAKQGRQGKAEHKVVGAFVSRLGGSSFVMDDGDDKFTRRTTPSEGPPDYASLEQGETDGLPEIPHNELIRLRTRTGHQILMHNSEDLIYIGNARGTAWIELTSDGKIDIYAEDSISIRTKQDFNFYADRDINFEAKRNVNIKSGARTQHDVGGNYNLVIQGSGKITTTGNLDISTSGNNNLTASGSTNLKSGGNHIETASQIHMNGPGAAAAAAAGALSTFANPDEAGSTTSSIMLRVPSHEPWPHHENLDPTKFKPTATDRDAGAAIPVPEAWKTYSTLTDTFAKVKASDSEEEE